MDSVTDKLFQCFGHRRFKSELQEQAVRAIARGGSQFLLFDHARIKILTDL